MQDWIGREMTQNDVLTPGLLARFRATLDSAETHAKAEQGIHWCLCLPEAATDALDSDGHQNVGFKCSQFSRAHSCRCGDREALDYCRG